MKIKIVLTFMLFDVIGGVFAPPAEAGVAAGISTWYTGWSYSNSNGDTKPGLLYGPAFSVDLKDKWSLAGVFLMGRLDEKTDYGTIKNRRYDCDITANYIMSRYLKLFGGIKLIHFSWNNDKSSVPVFGTGKSHNRSAGPALGVGLTVPVADSLFVQTNLSGLVTQGDQTVEGEERTAVRCYCVNTSLALAYYVESLSSTITFGGRYQFVRSKYEKYYSAQKMHFYGVTLSMIYHFPVESSQE
jgi:hypothetical protein